MIFNAYIIFMMYLAVFHEEGTHISNYNKSLYPSWEHSMLLLMMDGIKKQYI